MVIQVELALAVALSLEEKTYIKGPLQARPNNTLVPSLPTTASLQYISGNSTRQLPPQIINSSLTMTSIKAVLMLAAAAAAMVVPPVVDDGIIVARQTTEAPTPASSSIITPAPTTSIHCDYEYCDSGISWCFYFAGFQTFDPSRGPLPGETRTSIGPCATPTVAVTATPIAY